MARHDPVYGNNSFSGLRKTRRDLSMLTTQNSTNINTKTQNLQTDNVSLLNGSLTVNGISTFNDLLTTTGGHNLDGLTTLVGYMPTSFATASAGVYTSLSKTSGDSSVTSSNALTLPDNCYVYRIIVSNNNTTINPTTSSDYINIYASDTLNGISMNQTQINSGAATNIPNSTTNVGHWYPNPDSPPTSTGQNYVNVQNATTNTSGSLAVAISYYVFPQNF